jgi:peptidoglycan/xylan/chitin deacetylase (PgdA/CDA1 family)
MMRTGVIGNQSKKSGATVPFEEFKSGDHKCSDCDYATLDKACFKSHIMVVHLKLADAVSLVPPLYRAPQGTDNIIERDQNKIKETNRFNSSRKKPKWNSNRSREVKHVLTATM